jgi:hypothetical protein
MDLGFLVERTAGNPRVARHAALRLLDRCIPRAAKLEDLRAMEQAAPAECHELRLRVAPARERCRPFARAIERERALAAIDHAAVDHTGKNR